MTSNLSLALIAITTATCGLPSAQAGCTGYPAFKNARCSPENSVLGPRSIQNLPYRHYEDRRRYNAAPCCGDDVKTAPYWLKTEVVSKKRIPTYTTDERGKRRCHRVLTITYKALYSDGSCYVWTENKT